MFDFVSFPSLLTDKTDKSKLINSYVQVTPFSVFFVRLVRGIKDVFCSKGGDFKVI